MKPGLYVAATPIGNLKDITLRTIECLRAADLILCEDTRVTGKLARAYSITTKRLAYHDHNADHVRPQILERLQKHETICIVSDAGTPLISDPGYKLVRAVRDAGLPVFTLPGASALTAALSISGAPTDRFLFAGFLPAKAGARQKELARLSAIPATLVFYESGPRLSATLADMATIFGDRQAAVARELTKLYEEVREGSLAELANHYIDAGPPRGEIVLLVHPPAEKIWPEKDVTALLSRLLIKYKTKEAARMAADETGLPRKALYAIALDLKDTAPDG